MVSGMATLPRYPLALLWLLANAAYAKETLLVADSSLMELSLEELLRVEVSVTTRADERWFLSVAASEVLTQQDIRRSGATRLPELFRLIPGIIVSQQNSNQWVVSIRGSHSTLSDKLLVMLDGRSLYTTLHGGVFWDSQELDLSIIERIEFIRGPGGSSWGVNAVNGVINIITRHAKDAAEHSLRTTISDQGEWLNHYRQQHALAGGHIVHSLSYLQRPSFSEQTGLDAHDESTSWRWLSRYDQTLEQGQLMLQGSYYQADVAQRLTLAQLDPPFLSTVSTTNALQGGHILLNWQQHSTDDQQRTLQAFIDYYQRDNDVQFGERKMVSALEYTQSTFGNQFTYTFGGGYRLLHDELDNRFAVQFDPNSLEEQQAHLFAQYDHWSEDRKWRIGLGLKAEYSDLADVEWLPNFRLGWHPSEAQFYWLSASRAVRMPTRLERHGQLNSRVQPLPGNNRLITAVVGDDGRPIESLLAYELGSRWRLSEHSLLQWSLFHYDYEDMLSLQLGTVQPPSVEQPYSVLPFYFRGDLAATASGGELSIRHAWSERHRWQWQISYLHEEIRHQPAASALNLGPV